MHIVHPQRRRGEEEDLTPKRALFVGVDLGQATDFTAIAILDRIDEPQPRPGYRSERPAAKRRYVCDHLERMPNRTPYPAVVRHVAEIMRLSPGARLVVDYTGVGRPVVDSLEAAGLKPIPVTITGGDRAHQDHGWRVPKRDLVGALQVLLQSERLKIAGGLEFASTLTNELLNFRVKIDPLTAHDSYSAWREGVHDDLVLATAIAVWYAEQEHEQDLDFSQVPAILR